MNISRNIKGSFYLSGEVYTGDGSYITSAMDDYGFGGLDNVEIFLDTVGGSVFDGNAIYNYLKGIKAKKTIVINGIVASVGAIIMCAADKVKMSQNAFIMIHAPSASVSGTREEMIKNAEVLENMEKEFKNIFLEKTKQPKEVIESWFNGDNWFSAEKSVEYGLADEIIRATKKSTEITQIKNNYKAIISNKNNMKEKDESEEYVDTLIELGKLKGVITEKNEASFKALAVADFQKAKEFIEVSKTSVESSSTGGKVDSEYVDTLVELGKQKGIITEKNEASFKALAGVDYQKAKEFLTASEETKPKGEAGETINTIADFLAKYNKQNPTDDRANWTAKDWKEKDWTGYVEMSQKDKAKFNNLK